jgi:nitrogen fixation protein NifB
MNVADIHPCYSHDAHFKYGRVHLPVAPRCNIRCNYCDRRVSDCHRVFRPGVSARVVNAAEAVGLVGQALESEPRIRVAGIAGPGEPLANGETFATLQTVHECFPDLILCLSTNGVLLSQHAQALAALGVKTITVTVNSVNPSISAKIYSYVNYDHRRLEGVEAGELLLRKQLQGIEAAVEAGMLVKVNTVLIPGLNDQHLVEVSSEVARRGAWIQNIIPLIPLGNFKYRRPPTCDELRAAREACERFLPQFRHCKQCRADAVGVPGE